METMFVESRYKGKISDALLERIKEKLKPYKKVNLIGVIQYLDQMAYVKDKIKDKEFVLLSSKYRAAYPGQILGCDQYAAECDDCDVILAFTQGMFHIMGVLMKTEKKVINVDVENENIEEMDEKLVQNYKKRMMQAIGIALNAKKVMFVESIKSGQTAGAKDIKEKLAERGVEVYTIVFDEINFQRLNEFRDVDVFINTACQRIAIDDMDKLEKPIVNVEDLRDYLNN
ncbi:MAG: diphthamide synthesis protein [Candidatus Parvarchaeota archaeon]|nr:diphthamide synthesis protein [Candidatus Parvarchaeota archaeon]MCW1301571.1 diphthamide synthesis protein [Candidatus Parvarchaeota archaeon]